MDKVDNLAKDTLESGALEPWVQWVSIHTGRLFFSLISAFNVLSTKIFIQMSKKYPVDAGVTFSMELHICSTITNSEIDGNEKRFKYGIEMVDRCMGLILLEKNLIKMPSQLVEGGHFNSMSILKKS